MRISQPSVLVLDYLQRMMSWLLFLRPPGNLLQLGLGAGSLTKFSLENLTGSQVMVIERSSSVIQCAHQWFALPRRHARLQLVQADAGEILADASMASRFGVIQADLYDARARGPVLDSVRFYKDCFRALSSPGILAVNLFGDQRLFNQSVARLEKVFPSRLVIFDPLPEGNRIVLGLKGPPLEVTQAMLRRRANRVSRYYRLADASRWVDSLSGLSQEDVQGRVQFGPQ